MGSIRLFRNTQTAVATFLACVVVFFLFSSNSALPGLQQLTETRRDVLPAQEHAVPPQAGQAEFALAAELGSNTPFMPQMANETLKAELGRALWRLFHTILARYPDQPTAVQRQTLGLYILLFAQVYPCGDCARHFHKLLTLYPPQLSSRTTAAMWGCDLHNKVNKRLGKADYDCTTVLEDYDCGCGADEEDEKSGKAGSGKVRAGSVKGAVKPRDFAEEHIDDVSVEVEPEQLGG